MVTPEFSLFSLRSPASLTLLKLPGEGHHSHPSLNRVSEAPRPLLVDIAIRTIQPVYQTETTAVSTTLRSFVGVPGGSHVQANEH